MKYKLFVYSNLDGTFKEWQYDSMESGLTDFIKMSKGFGLEIRYLGDSIEAGGKNNKHYIVYKQIQNG
jgi:hypothetical protein